MKRLTDFFKVHLDAPFTALLGLLVAFTLLTSGCSTLRGIAEKIEAPERVAKLIDSYCDEVPLAARLETRAAVNALTVRGDVRVDCDGDPVEKIEAPERAAKLIDSYCDEVPLAARLETRAAVRGDVRVDCDGNPVE
jgi:hypothetical protein